MWDWPGEFCSQLCLRSSTVVSPQASCFSHRQDRAPSMVFLAAAQPQQDSEHPLALGSTSLLATRLLLPFYQELGCSLTDAAARSDPFPARACGCATPLAAKENPWLASASSSRILEHVSERVHHHPLAHGHPAREFGSPALCPYMGNCSEPAWVTAARTGPGAAPGQQHTENMVVRSCWLCPSPQDCPLSHCQEVLQGSCARGWHQCHPG